MKNFAVVGAAGYIAARHLAAIAATGNTLVAVVDPRDAVGIVDRYSLHVEYFPSFEALLEYIHKTKHSEQEVHYVSVCSPNHLHFSHCLGALYAGTHVICEKPLVIVPEHLNALAATEAETGKRIRPILQFRLHPKLAALREALVERSTASCRHDVSVTFILPRGKWYASSWKGTEEQSGGIAMHIGIHVFDLLLWLFGKVDAYHVHYRDGKRLAGFLELERARVRWFLSIDGADLPPALLATPGNSYRSVTIGGQEIEFSKGRMQLHTSAYQEVLVLLR